MKAGPTPSNMDITVTLVRGLPSGLSMIRTFNWLKAGHTPSNSVTTTIKLLSGLPSGLSMIRTVNWWKAGPTPHHTVERLTKWLVYD